MINKLKRLARQYVNEQMYNKLMVPRHYAESMIFSTRHGFPAMSMRVIAVTGTNGKTTTCNMLASIFTEAGYKVGLLSTATMQLGETVTENTTHLTTAGGRKVQSLLARMRDRGCDTVILEVSSHALVQGRVWGIPIDTAVMTNLSQDHLDYHGTMENYAAAKAKLFARAKSASVLNIDDAWFHTFEQASSAPVKTYGVADLADTRLVRSSLKADGATFTVATEDDEASFHINQTGQFNVYNAMAAITVARFYEISDELIQKGFLSLKSVPGRMQFITEGQPFSVVIDHAHTVDALYKLFAELKKLGGKRLLVVIGCDGDRDKAKRAPIGKLCAEQADVLYLTELENYTEDSEKIRAMVREGVQEVPKSERATFVEITDRREAIAAALKEAQPGDIVAIPGLGNQDYRGMGDKKITWDDREVVREELKKLIG